MISLCCSTLAVDDEGAAPFGLQWIQSGQLGAFVGTVGPVEVEPLVRITSLLLEERGKQPESRLVELVRGVDAAVRRAGDGLLETWSKFRLLGNPLQPV